MTAPKGDLKYGYLWWLIPKEFGLKKANLGADAYMAVGAGGQWLVVVPEHRMVVVHLTQKGEKVKVGEFSTVLNLIQKADPCFEGRH
jgi:CubicO group peptidase (beta-lactamase class C family)